MLKLIKITLLIKISLLSNAYTMADGNLWPDSLFDEPAQKVVEQSPEQTQDERFSQLKAEHVDSLKSIVSKLNLTIAQFYTDKKATEILTERFKYSRDDFTFSMEAKDENPEVHKNSLLRTDFIGFLESEDRFCRFIENEIDIIAYYVIAVEIYELALEKLTLSEDVRNEISNTLIDNQESLIKAMIKEKKNLTTSKATLGHNLLSNIDPITANQLAQSRDSIKSKNKNELIHKSKYGSLECYQKTDK